MEPFIPIRNGLLEHIRQGKLCPTDLGVYTFLHLTADWATGVCHTCATGIAVQFNDPKLTKLVQRSLQRLRASGYINYRPGDGQRGLYAVLLNKYEPRVGGLCGMRLNAFAAGSLEQPVYEPANSRATVEGTEERPIQEVQEVQEESEARKPRRRATGLPPDFQPNESHRKLACKLGVDLEEQFAQFRDWVADKGVTSKDWSARLRNFIRKAPQFQRANQQPKPTEQVIDALTAKERLAQEAEQRYQATRSQAAGRPA
jgi:hypothetical protein